MPLVITILPPQAMKIAEVTAKTGAAVRVSQQGSVLILDMGEAEFRIDAKGEEIQNPDQETLC